MSHHDRYAIITPAYNEEIFLPQVIESVAGQTIRPVEWIIVDDRSTDDTWALLHSIPERYSFIRPLRLTGDARRRVGANVVHVFHYGLAHLTEKTEFIVKMDADVILPPHYFSTLMKMCHDNHKLGMVSGKTYCRQKKGTWIMERCPDFHVVGPCKLYRKQCLDDIGGLIPLLGWDILDRTMASFLGWQTRSFRDLPVYHQRLMGSAKGIIRGRLRTGRVMYTIRAHPLFVLAKSMYRMIEKPYFAAALIPLGYFYSFFTRPPRLNDPELAAFLRKEQINRLLGRTRDQEILRPRTINETLSPPSCDMKDHKNDTG